MKIVVLVGDGMGDYPVASLGQKTPLQVAKIPNIRRLAAAGKVMLVETVPAPMQPGSDVANMSLLGYNPADNYTGRAPIEAAGAGIVLGPDDIAFRCNLITTRDGLMDDYSAGHATTAEGESVIDDLQREFGSASIRFYPGVGYRHLVIWRNGPVDAKTWPPHDIALQPVATYEPSGERADEIRKIMHAAQEILATHPVNQARASAGKKPINAIWLWGQGRSMKLPSYRELYGLSGGVVSAVDLVRGLGLLAGLEAPIVPGATGFLDTNVPGKVAAALDLIERKDFAYLHFEAPDECGHMGDLEKKIRAIEMFDEGVVAPVWRALEKKGEPYCLVVTTDHRTPVVKRGHTSEPVPLAVLFGPLGRTVGDEAAFDESSAGGQVSGYAFNVIRELLMKKEGGRV